MMGVKANALPVVQGPRCSGHCCRSFAIPFTLEDLLEKQAEIQDGSMIADMVIDLGNRRFTCRHLVRDSGDCSVYDTRPRMCRDYPYGGTCQYPGCTLKSVVVLPTLTVEK